jgi:hypothetical protein
MNSVELWFVKLSCCSNMNYQDYVWSVVVNYGLLMCFPIRISVVQS